MESAPYGVLRGWMQAAVLAIQRRCVAEGCSTAVSCQDTSAIMLPHRPPAQWSPLAQQLCLLPATCEYPGLVLAPSIPCNAAAPSALSYTDRTPTASGPECWQSFLSTYRAAWARRHPPLGMVLHRSSPDWLGLARGGSVLAVLRRGSGVEALVAAAGSGDAAAGPGGEALQLPPHLDAVHRCAAEAGALLGPLAQEACLSLLVSGACGRGRGRAGECVRGLGVRSWSGVAWRRGVAAAAMKVSGWRTAACRLPAVAVLLGSSTLVYAISTCAGTDAVALFNTRAPCAQAWTHWSSWCRGCASCGWADPPHWRQAPAPERAAAAAAAAAPAAWAVRRRARAAARPR